MSRATALVAFIEILFWQHSMCDIEQCSGPSVLFWGSCYHFVTSTAEFEDAEKSCLTCGGHLASVSEEHVAELPESLLNESSSWWIGNEAKANGSSETSSPGVSCMALTHSAEIKKTSCDQKRRFICQTEGQSCYTSSQQLATTPSVDEDMQSEDCAQRSAVENTSDLAFMVDLFPNTSNVGGSSLGDLLIDISDVLQDGKKINRTELNRTLSLLQQLSERIQNSEIGSSPYFANLSNVLYFGIHRVLQSVLSSCSDISWTPEEKQPMISQALDILQLSIHSSIGENGVAILMQTPTFSLQRSSVNTSDLGQRVLAFPKQTQNPTAQFVFPKQSALPQALNNLPAVQIQMMSFAQNPFLLDSALNVSGTVGSLSLMSGIQELHIENLSDNFQIFLPRSPKQLKSPTHIQISGDKAVSLSLSVNPPGSTLVIIITVNHGVHLQLYHGSHNVEEALQTQGNSTDTYMWILPPELFSGYISTETFLVTPTNSSETQNLQLNISSFTARCVFREPDTQQWKSDGCKVGPQTSMEQVHCLCNHLSFFGTSFLVLPVQVDVTLTAEYFSQVSDNPVIVILLACFYACYIFTVIWARRMDLWDQAQVFLSLCGSNGQWGPIILSDSRHKLFRNGSVDIFLLTTPFPLGELLSITLSHDGTGSRKSWYVAQVTAQDMQLKKSWHFLCNLWLSKPPRGESLTQTFSVAKEQELTSFRNIFFKKTMKGFQEENIWISVLNHPTRSMFTRVQRVSCCMCLLLCTIVINLMFWELPQASYPILISVGSFTLTWKEIMIGFESALLMFPVNLLIIFIFRNTRPRLAAKTKTRKGSQKPLCRCGISTPSKTFCLTSVLEVLKTIIQTLNQAFQNNLVNPEIPLESTHDIGFLLQVISNMLQKQPLPDLMISVPLAQLPADELRTLFCAHYVSRKLRKVSEDLYQLGDQEFQDKLQYEESLRQLQTLLHLLDKSVPPLPTQRSSRKQHIAQRRLPWWFLLIGWAMLVSVSAVSTYFTMMYGFQYGRQSSIRWIISMALSLFQSIFILQPLKVIGFAVFFALILKKVEEEELDEELLSPEEEHTCEETIL